MTAIQALALLALIAAASFAAGRALLARLPGWQSGWERALYSVALGLGLAAYAVLAIGLLGWLRRPVVAGLLALMLLCLLARRNRGARAPAGSALHDEVDTATAVVWAARLFLAGAAVLWLIGALAPPGQSDWDGLSYHLAVPKIYLRDARIHYLGWESHSNFPFTWEMLYTAGLMLQGAQLAKLFHWLAGCLAAGAAYFAARQAAGARAGLLAACCFAAMPLVGWEATVAGNDLAAAMFTLLALGAFLRWTRTSGGGWLWTSAAFAGFAAGCKMTALLSLAFLAVAALVAGPGGKRLGRAALFALIALAIAAPWYIKSAVWTGNPVYPFFYSIFGGRYWSAAAAAEYSAEQMSFGMGRGPLALLLLPWNLTMHANRFSNLPGGAFTILTQSLGPLLLALVPLLWLRRLQKDEKVLLAYCLAALTAWFWTSQHIRYLLPTGAVLCVLAGVGADKAVRAGIGKVVGAAFAVVAVWGTLVLGLGALDCAGVAFGAEPESDYLSRTLPMYPVVQQVNSLPPGSKLIMYGETRGFYFDRDYMMGDHHHEMLRYDRMRDARQLIAGYRRLGVTHALMTQATFDAVRTQHEPLARLLREALRQRLLVPVAQSPGYAIFEVR